ncbi:MAG: Fic family protein [SAR202 cluster bacterium]|nr:Fic family protein [SAR202 cluster bacterium]
MLPTFAVTDSMKYSLADLDRLKWLVASQIFAPRHEGWLVRSERQRRAAATAALENCQHAAAKSADEANALRAYEFIDFVSEMPDAQVQEFVLREVHRQLTIGRRGSTPGHYRKEAARPAGYRPAGEADIPVLVRELTAWLAGDTQTHTVLKAGIAHIQLLAIHPFTTGNGSTTRAVSGLFLQKSQFSFRKMLNLELTLAHVRDRYISTVTTTLGAEFSNGYDATRWLEFYTAAVSIAAQDLVNRLNNWHRLSLDLGKDDAEMGLPSRLVDGHLYAMGTGQITRSEYMDLTGMSELAATRDLAKLVDKGLLTYEGKTKSRVYRPKR